MAIDITGIAAVLRVIIGLFGGKKIVVTPDIRSIIKDRIFRIEGVHRISLIEITNGDSSLREDKKMYMSVIYICENSRFVTSMPEINRLELDGDMKELVRRVLGSGFEAIFYGDVRHGTIIKGLMKSYGANYSESYLLKRKKKVAYMLSMSTAEIETNPFDKSRTEIEIQIDAIRRKLK